MLYKNIIAFDYGIKKIGIAIGQKINSIALPIGVLNVKNKKVNFNDIKKLFIEWEPYLIIVGLPLNMNGTEQKISFLSRKFAKKIFEKFKITVKLQDERLSTVEAKSKLFDIRGYKSLKKSHINSLSAAIILNSWFKKNKIT